MSVQVQYTIPGWQPTHIEQQIASESAPFRTQMEVIAAPALDSVPAMLGLNRPQPGELYLDPPPRPAGVPYTDAAEERRQWHGIMGRHGETGATDPKTAGMMAVLARLQDMQDKAAMRMLQGGSR
jgi:hypothetical protein